MESVCPTKVCTTTATLPITITRYWQHFSLFPLQTAPTSPWPAPSKLPPTPSFRKYVHFNDHDGLMRKVQELDDRIKAVDELWQQIKRSVLR
jgi:hypothetical protein